MKIGIVGAGNIGKTLSRELSAAGHDVKIANSRRPETIDLEALFTGARAVEASDAVRDVEVVILSMPLHRMPAFASALSAAPADAVVIDTSNEVGMMLVDQTGFDGFDAGPISQSWRPQPGAPCYCTDLTSDEMGDALANAEKGRLPKRRDISIAAITERVGDGTTNPDSDYAVRLTRALFT